MILILGGTTEGRLAVKVADEAGSPYYYSTKGSLQQVTCRNGTRLTGGLDAEAMTDFCRQHDIRLLVDAAHPFAVGVHAAVASTSEALNLPVVRVERRYPARSEDIVWCDDYADAVRRLHDDGIKSLLALTGVHTIDRLRDYWQEHTCWFRILAREESMAQARGQGFDEQHLVYYSQDGSDDDDALLGRLSPQAILTKESGESGGFLQKVEAARRHGIAIYAVKRPPLSKQFLTVTGEYGLRKQIEKYVPGFFPLRSGYTTGACATAASKAALLMLLGEEDIQSVPITFPDGETLELPIAEVIKGKGDATATVIKDAGDDPDITDGQRIVSTVSFSSTAGIHFLQGEGVGKVTLPGLGLEIGGPAINRVPRRMIEQELSALYTAGGLDVTISVPGGRELAKRTFNPRLGIADGISIIGTSGIVRPFSSEAFVGAIRREIEVCKAVGAQRLVINSGAKSERFMKALYPELPAQAFVHYGNFIGETLKIATELDMQHVSLGIMIGKAVKLAEGHLDTHSKNVVMNKDFLSSLALEAGCSASAIEAIEHLTLSRELWTAITSSDAEKFFHLLAARCLAVARTCFPKGELTLFLLDEDGKAIKAE